MKKLFACLAFAVVCLAVVTAFAQEAPAATKEVTASAVPAPTPVVVEKGGILVQNKSPINVEVNVPEQPAPEVTVENEIKFPKVMKVKNTDRTWCERHPVGCTFLIVGVVGGVTAGGFIIADQLDAFDNTNTVSYR